MYYAIRRSSELYHYGIMGQKWGIRRYQNEDGSLTPEGKKRYGKLVKYYEDSVNKSRKVYQNEKRGKIDKKTENDAKIATNKYINELDNVGISSGEEARMINQLLAKYADYKGFSNRKNSNSIKTKIQKKGYKIASNYVTQKDASKTRNRVFNELNRIEKSGATISAKDIEIIKSEIQKDAPSDKKIDNILNKYK